MSLPLSSCTFGLLLGDSTRLNASDAKHLDARSCDTDVVIRFQSGFASVIELGVGDSVTLKTYAASTYSLDAGIFMSVKFIQQRP